MGARLVNALLGVWLYLAAFLWPHTPLERNNAWVSGIVAVTAARRAPHGGGETAASASTRATGSVNRTVVPRPGELSIQMRPWCATTIPLAM